MVHAESGQCIHHAASLIRQDVQGQDAEEHSSVCQGTYAILTLRHLVLCRAQ
jgi:hypothetical protein